MDRKKIYFASDFHLGSPDEASSRRREKKIVAWLESIAHDCGELILAGDVFDFWFEYKRVVPKGHTRLLGQLARMADQGVRIHFFTGNHDMWVGDYFQREFGAEVHRGPITIERDGKIFYIGHGDGLGPGDRRFKWIKKAFQNPFLIACFGFLPSSWGLTLMQFFSKKSRDAQDEERVTDIRSERLVQYCEAELQLRACDYFVFGHRHVVIDHTLSNGTSRYINLGDWLGFCSYAVWDGRDLSLNFYQNDNPHDYIYA